MATSWCDCLKIAFLKQDMRSTPRQKPTILWTHRKGCACFWPDSEPTKLLDHPKQKPRRGGGLRQINTSQKVPLQVDFLRRRHFALPSTLKKELTKYFDTRIGWLRTNSACVGKSFRHPWRQFYNRYHTFSTEFYMCQTSSQQTNFPHRTF